MLIENTMKRDMDLVRRILLRVEQSSVPVPYEEFASDEHSLECVSYHVQLMQAHGLIDASTHKSWGGDMVRCEIEALTWDGCDYLDAIRDDRVWNKAKKAVAEAVGSTTMGLFKEAALMVAKQMIAAALGM